MRKKHRAFRVICDGARDTRVVPKLLDFGGKHFEISGPMRKEDATGIRHQSDYNWNGYSNAAIADGEGDICKNFKLYGDCNGDCEATSDTGCDFYDDLIECESVPEDVSDCVIDPPFTDPRHKDTFGIRFKNYKDSVESGLVRYASGNGYIHTFTREGVVFVPCDSWSKVVDQCRGMYTMRMLEGGAGAADSDSAVSSMGSERVPSLTSDTDWMETNSDSGHTPADHFMATAVDSHSKLRWYDYNYCRQHSGEQAGAGGNTHRMPPVAQKKYHLFGKRLFQEQLSTANSGPPLPTGSGGSPAGSAAGTSSTRSPTNPKLDYGSITAPQSQTSIYDHPASPLDMVKPQPLEIKYSCSLEFARQNICGVRSSPGESAVHNHTYHLPPEHLGILQRPLTRDKRSKDGSNEDLSASRDERRARALNIPIPVSDIINLPMDEFNERLSKFDLSETQLSLIRDIRRRGKNKVAAQNCRKRKLDQIMSLADEVKIVREKKQRLLKERDCLLQERMRVKNTVSQLFRHIFQSLRDDEGNSYSPHRWSLEEAPDGTIVLVPREASDLSRPHHASSDPSSHNEPNDPDLHQPSTSKKQLHPRKHVP